MVRREVNSHLGSHPLVEIPKIRTYKCGSCGFAADRDFNAVARVRAPATLTVNLEITVSSTVFACGGSRKTRGSDRWESLKQEANSNAQHCVGFMERI